MPQINQKLISQYIITRLNKAASVELPDQDNDNLYHTFVFNDTKVAKEAFDAFHVYLKDKPADLTQHLEQHHIYISNRSVYLPKKAAEFLFLSDLKTVVVALLKKINPPTLLHPENYADDNYAYCDFYNEAFFIPAFHHTIVDKMILLFNTAGIHLTNVKQQYAYFFAKKADFRTLQINLTPNNITVSKLLHAKCNIENDLPIERPANDFNGIAGLQYETKGDIQTYKPDLRL